MWNKHFFDASSLPPFKIRFFSVEPVREGAATIDQKSLRQVTICQEKLRGDRRILGAMTFAITTLGITTGCYNLAIMLSIRQSVIPLNVIKRSVVAPYFKVMPPVANGGKTTYIIKRSVDDWHIGIWQSVIRRNVVTSLELVCLDKDSPWQRVGSGLEIRCQWHSGNKLECLSNAIILGIVYFWVRPLKWGASWRL